MKPLLLLVSLTCTALPAWAAPDPGASPSGSSAVKVEPVPNSPVKRVTLAAKAHERLGIEMGMVEEAPVARRQIVGGLVVAPQEAVEEDAASAGASASPFGGYVRPRPAQQRISHGPRPAAGETWVQVSLSQAEYDMVMKDQPARIRPLATQPPHAREITAALAGIPPVEDPKRSMLTVYYRLNGADHGLKPYTRIRVELPQTGSAGRHNVVPYGALYYDAKGAAWVYVSPQPLSFQRVPVKVTRVIGEHAVLAEGPPAGTPVVKVGAAMLFGAEVFGK